MTASSPVGPEFIDRCCGGWVELRNLEVFRVLARERHFGRAAQRLYLAQSSVSQQLQRLEAELGVQLLHRTSRQVELTPAGEVFLDQVEQILTHVDSAVQLTRQAAAGRRGAVRIAANYPASRLLLLPLLERLRREAPHLSTLLRELSTEEQIPALERGELDLGLAFGPVEHPDLRSVPLLEVPVVATVRIGHPLAGRSAVSYPDLRRHRYLTGFRGSGTRMQEAVLRAAAEHGVQLAAVHGTTDLTSYLLELEATDAVGFCSAPRGEQNRASGMHVLRLSPVEPTVPVHAVLRRDVDEPWANTLLEHLLGVAAAASGP